MMYTMISSRMSLMAIGLIALVEDEIRVFGESRPPGDVLRYDRSYTTPASEGDIPDVRVSAYEIEDALAAIREALAWVPEADTSGDGLFDTANVIQAVLAANERILSYEEILPPGGIVATRKALEVAEESLVSLLERVEVSY